MGTTCASHAESAALSLDCRDRCTAYVPLTHAPHLLPQVVLLQMTGMVYLNCWYTLSMTVKHESHLKVPLNSSGRTATAGRQAGHREEGGDVYASSAVKAHAAWRWHCMHA